MIKKVIFLDRDGVINKKAAPHEYITRWEDFEFLPGVFKSLKIILDKGYRIIIVTNQRGVSRKKMSIEDVEIIHTKMLDSFKDNEIIIDALYLCPHDEGECDCRKPKIGMIKKALKYFEIDLDNSFVVGDSKSDIELGINAGIKTIYIGSDEGLQEMADYSFEGLIEVANFLK